MWFFKKKQAETRMAMLSSDPRIGEVLGGIDAANIDRTASLGIAAAAVNLISSSIASAELGVYKLNDDGVGATLDTAHPLYHLLVDESYPGVSAFDMKQLVSQDLAVHGNAYLRIHRNGRSEVSGLEPMAHADVNVEVVPSTGRMRYRWTNPLTNIVLVLTADEVVHFRFRPKFAGGMGRSPISLASTAAQIATSLEENTAEGIENSFRPAGLISFPEATPADFKDNLRTSFREKFLGKRNANQLMVLDNGATWTSLGFSQQDQEILSSRKWAAFELARIWNLPPSTLGIVEGSTFNNSQEEGLALVKRTLRPWARRIEQQLICAVMSPEARKRRYLEHDLSEFLQGGIRDRYEAYKIAHEGGFLSVDEIRARENYGRVPNGAGAGFIQPLNYAPLGSVSINGQHNTAQVSA